MPHRPIFLLPQALLLALALTACGDRGDEGGNADAQSAEGLPAPAGSQGVTGNAEVAPGGDGSVPALGNAPPPEPEAPAVDPFFSGLPTTAEVNPETGLGVDPDGDGPLTAPPAADVGAAEPTAADAVAIVRDYYAAINAGDYAGAYRLWSGSGAASGQTPDQFANGFAQTRGVNVEIGAPGRVDAGAGSRYVQVPVGVQATQADGSVRRFGGTYTLQRSVVDGATPEQRLWRIRGADLREVQP